MVSPDESPRVRVCFGRSESRLAIDASGIDVKLCVPHLSGPAEEVVLSIPGGMIQLPEPGMALLTNDHWMAGAVVRPWRGPLDESAATQYRDLLRQTHGWTLARIWNYVPHINSETTGLENYRRFNLGRWQAYHEVFGDQLATHLPAASAVGLNDDTLVTVFVATRGTVERIENPQQLPAWQYPAAYGPKAPSFVRATRATAGGRGWAWVSGTASIRGHASVAVGDVPGQLAITLQNLQSVKTALALPPPMPSDPHPPPLFTKVYLRHPHDLSVVQAGLAATAPDATILVADICRAELELEIEIAASIKQID